MLMKKLPRSAVFVAVLALVVLSGASAAEGPKAKIFAKYDANKNGIIAGDEIAAVRKAIAAEPKGEFASYDKNADGKLDEAEIAAIKPPGAKKDGEKKSGGKKNTQPEATEKK